MTDCSQVPARFRFVGGRRHYNAVRRFAAADRRRRLIDLVCQCDRRGERVSGRKLANWLHVSEATISRDLGKLGNGLHWRMRIPWGRLLERW